MPAFEARPSQREMAEATAQILIDGGILLAEAGTGTGKTLAYLVPAILSKQQVLISTGTKNLQDQIYYKDLPALREALGIDVHATYMKGRNNYLCLHRFAALKNEMSTLPVVEQGYLEQLTQWADQTATGDRAEIEDLPDDFSSWSDIAATSENCIGTECPEFQECYVTKMRQQALDSDIVIVNHHLLCADAAVRQSAYGEVIPTCSFTIIDEAHQLEDVATQYFGISVSNNRLEELNRDGRRLITDTLADADSDNSYMQELSGLLSGVHDGAQIFFNSLALTMPEMDRARLTTELCAPIVEPGRRLIKKLEDFVNALARFTPSSEDIAALGHRAAKAHEDLTFILEANEQAFVYYLERRGRGVFLRASPIDVSSIVRELLFDRMQGTVLTSATLSVDGTFEYLKSRLGLNHADTLRLPSEFDYRTQSILYLPRTMPLPNTRGFTDAVTEEVRSLLRITSGRAFLLFTSYANLRGVHEQLESTVPYPLLAQGTAPRTVLLREFKETPNAVLLATASFWQGVDVSGDTLSCVVIDKLPFASPGDPLTAARMENIEEHDGNPFSDYQVPLAVLALLQGLGRLLRHRSDRGVLAILDPRLRTKGYGKRFLDSIPPAPVTHKLSDVDRFFNDLKLKSTKT
ncbi:MAG: ATP-dependent DNA helicase [Acidobacteriota bacterium]|nr:ATP-dependent DNA helicase [Acidobacteriota bacterium]